MKCQGYEILGAKKEGKKENREDIGIITNRLMKFLLRSYGRVVYCEKMQMNQNRLALPYTIYIFSGFNHDFHHLVYGIGFIQD